MRCGSIVFSLLLLSTVCHSQITLGIGAGAAALALGAVGAAGAGLAVAALARGIGGRRRGGRSFRRGGGRRRFRGRRAVLEEEEVEIEEESTVWDMVGAADQAACVQKLICLLEAAANEADDDEQTVLAFVGDLERPAKKELASKLPYEVAGWLGKYRGAPACQAFYGTQCPHSKADMMQLISSIWSSMTTEQPASDATTA